MSATVSFIKEPYEFNPINAPTYVVATSSSYGLTGFNYIFRLYSYDRVGTSSQYLGEYSIPPRPTGEGVFDTHKILKSSINPAYKLDVTDISSVSPELIPTPDDAIVKFRYKYGYEMDITNNDIYNSFFAIQSTGPSAYGNPVVGLLFLTQSNIYFSTGDTINVSMSASSVNTAYNGYSLVTDLQLINFFGLTLSLVYTNIPFGTYSPIGYDQGNVTYLKHISGTSSEKWGVYGTRQYYDPSVNGISNQDGITDTYDNGDYILKQTGTEYNFLSSYNGYKEIFGSCDDNPNSYDQFETISILAKTHSSCYMEVNMYDINFQLTDTYNLSTFGLTQNYMLYNLPIGTANLTGVGGLDFADNSYYDVILHCGSQSATVKRKIIHNQSPYPNIRLMFLNQIGGYDYWNFNYDSKISTSIDRKMFNQTISYDYQVGDRGRSIFAIDAETQTIINTDWVSEEDYNYLRELFLSQEVYVITEKVEFISGRWTTTDINKLPIYITDANWEQKTRLREKIFNCVVMFKYAYNINTQGF